MRKGFAAIVIAALGLAVFPIDLAEAKTFRNCVELRKSFPTGVSASKFAINRGLGPILNPRVSSSTYRQNSKLDLDKDKIICEVFNKWSAPPSSAPADPYQFPLIASQPIDQCRIREASLNDAMYGEQNLTKTGFPVARPTTSSGKVKWALIPIQFSDSDPQGDFRPRVEDQMRLLSEWFRTVSGGKFNIEWVVASSWVTLPGKANDYLIPTSVNVNDAPNGPKLFRDAMLAADPTFDFTNVQTVNFILPKGQSVVLETSQGFPWDEVVQQVVTREGRVHSFSIAGVFMDDPRRSYWSYWAHEFGHAMGLPHIGSSRGPQPQFNPWDLMGGQDGTARELSGWLRFLAGWLDEEQIYCQELSKVRGLEISLVPLSDNRNGIKLAAIPLSKTKILLLESRRETKFSCKSNPPRNGVLVYVYDATLGHNQDFLVAAEPPGRISQSTACLVAPNPDFLLRAGDKVSVAGLTIEVTEHKVLDKVKITSD